MVAAKEVLDRVEGKVPQRHSSDDGSPLQMITRIERVIVTMGQGPGSSAGAEVIEGEAEEIVGLPAVPKP
jgi:hypothetical protein